MSDHGDGSINNHTCDGLDMKCQPLNGHADVITLGIALGLVVLGIVLYAKTSRSDAMESIRLDRPVVLAPWEKR